MESPVQPVVRDINVYPVKSVGGYRLDEVPVEPWGPVGDRRWMVVDASGKAVTQRERARLALAAARALPDGSVRVSAPGREDLTVAVPEPIGPVTVTLFGKKVEAIAADETAHAWFSDHLEAEVRLVHLDDPATRRPIDPDFALPGETVSFADGFPLLITTTASLDALNSLIAQGTHPHEGPLPMNRFRPNVVIDGTEAWAEDHWTRIALGDVVFRVAKPCGRCVVTTTDQASAERGREPLRTLGRHRRFGTKLVFGQNLVPEGPGVIRTGDPLRVLA
ncbi:MULTISPECIES: MOSC N-terminal beta barrel domain-containing protein [unclassified Streptomyces]|uniref:MOSC domain-containing protein n=1 Tax=unclassified Streptomyces TaxID=2593676 RepID=UPI0033CA9674